MSRILLVTIHYWPEISGNAPYTTMIAEHLAAEGHDVAVLAGMPHYPAGRIQPPYRGRLTAFEEHRGVAIHRRAHYVPGRQSAFRRVVYEGTFLLTGSLTMGRPPPDAIVGVSPSLSGAALAAELAYRFRRPFGLILQDLMGRAAEQSGIAGGRTVARATAAAECWLARRAAAVGIVAPEFRGYLAESGVAPSRIVDLANWAHITASVEPPATTRARLGWGDDETVVVHAGNMGLKQGLEQVIEAARLAHVSRARVRFVLMGDGNQRTALERGAAGLQTVAFRPFEPAATFADVLAAADVLLVSERPTVRDMSLPSKVTSYLAVGRPIVGAVVADGATARLLRSTGAARLVDAGDPDGLLRAIVELRDDPEAAKQLNSAGRAYVAGHLSPDLALARISDFVARVATSGAVGRNTRP